MASLSQFKNIKNFPSKLFLMDHLKARTNRNISKLKEKLPDYEIEIDKGDISGPKISFFSSY